jgi:pimeloyl-ACP methyl ester carboxylesterase
MTGQETIAYFQGVGDQPTEQERLPELLSKFGFEVVFLPFDWNEDNYGQRREEVVDAIRQLGRAHLWGESAGGVAAVDILARHPDLVGRVVSGSAKLTDLYVGLGPKYRNLMPSSHSLAESKHNIHGKMLERLLCVYPVEDEEVNPETAVLKGAHELEVKARGHIEGIRHTVTHAAPTIAHFFRHGEVRDLV